MTPWCWGVPPRWVLVDLRRFRDLPALQGPPLVGPIPSSPRRTAQPAGNQRLQPLPVGWGDIGVPGGSLPTAPPAMSPRVPTGRIGVAAVTAGPGVTNAVTALKNAQLAESPLLLLGGAAATLQKVGWGGGGGSFWGGFLHFRDFPHFGVFPPFWVFFSHFWDFFL